MLKEPPDESLWFGLNRAMIEVTVRDNDRDLRPRPHCGQIPLAAYARPILAGCTPARSPFSAQDHA
jgi:hypothetical protein